MSQNLIKKLRSYIEFNEDEQRFIETVFRVKHFAKGEHFLLAGDVCCEAAFIESGVFRFYINTDERDATYYFAAENEFICDYPSFLPQRPSSINIQALEPAEIQVISYDDLQRFYRTINFGERFGRNRGRNFRRFYPAAYLFLPGQARRPLPEFRSQVSSTGPASSPVLHRLVCRYRAPVFKPHPATVSLKRTQQKI